MVGRMLTRRGWDRRDSPIVQPGHVGRTRDPLPEPDRTREHRLDQCPDCNGKLRRTGDTRSRRSEDIDVRLANTLRPRPSAARYDPHRLGRLRQNRQHSVDASQSDAFESIGSSPGGELEPARGTSYRQPRSSVWPQVLSVRTPTVVLISLGSLLDQRALDSQSELRRVLSVILLS